jgi:uncharacterized protein YggU (UPF0235/DUF167 family)
MQNIEIMLSDGFIGNKAILLALSALTTGNLNAKLKPNAKSFSMQDILPSTHDYIVPPLTEEEQREQANKKLMAFMAASPKAPESLRKAFNGGNI